MRRLSSKETTFRTAERSSTWSDDPACNERLRLAGNADFMFNLQRKSKSLRRAVSCVTYGYLLVDIGIPTEVERLVVDQHHIEIDADLVKKHD